MKLYMFRAVPLPIIRSLFTVNSAVVYMSYRFVDSFRAGPRWSCSKAIFKPIWHIPVRSVQWINSWWWAEELPETCRAVFLNHRAAARYQALTSIIPGRERPEENTICYKISLLQWLISNLNVILYLSTCHTVYISVLILFMIMP